MARAKQTAPSGYTAAADLVRGLIDCAERCGIPRPGTIAEAPGAPVFAPSAERYSIEQVFALWARFIRLSGDPIIGHRMALFADAKTFGLLGQIMSRSASALDAFRQAERYSTLTAQPTRIGVSCDEAALTVTVTIDAPSSPVRDNILLWGLTNLSLFPLRFAQPGILPRSIECTAAPVGAAHERILRRTLPFSLGAPVNRIIFDPHVGTLQLVSADRQLHSVLAEVMDQRMAELEPAATFERGLAVILRGMLNGTMPTLPDFCKRMGFAPRTLQRRLSESKTSFQKLLKVVLREVSDELLERGTLSQGEIAFLLGYSEESAFSRAYRSWTGHAPGGARSQRSTQ